MSTASLPPIKLIKTQKDLRGLVKKLSRESLLAIDTESNSLYAYQEQVCLIQISTRRDDYIIDPLCVTDLQPLASLMADERIEKVFHAAEYDVITMKRDFGYEFINIFDTMMAARILGMPEVGLGNLLKHFFNVNNDKRHQRDNWGARPLSKDSLHYAQKDTHFLPKMRDILNNMLAKQGRLQEAMETFQDVTLIEAPERPAFDPNGYWKLGIPNRLTSAQMKVLRELYKMRDDYARQKNRPAFKIIGNKTLILLAQHAPRRMAQLHTIHGMTKPQIRRYGDSILEAVECGRASQTLPEPPRHTPPASEVTDRYAALHAWRKERAIERGVESDVIVSKQTLWDLAFKAPDQPEKLVTIQGMGPWRRQAYGNEILNVLDGLK